MSLGSGRRPCDVLQPAVSSWDAWSGGLSRVQDVFGLLIQKVVREVRANGHVMHSRIPLLAGSLSQEQSEPRERRPMEDCVTIQNLYFLCAFGGAAMPCSRLYCPKQEAELHC